MSGAELKALIPDDATVYFSSGDEVMAEDIMKDNDGDIFIAAPEGDDEEDEEFEDEDEDADIEVDA